ncbi:MAG: hypothetical protein GY842_16265, partial [bacterium]|nr:hypothetical protein [bacterium]
MDTRESSKRTVGSSVQHSVAGVGAATRTPVDLAVCEAPADTTRWRPYPALLFGVWVLCGMMLSSSLADERAADDKNQTDEDRLIEAIDVGPYEVPELTLKRDHNYAFSATDVEPFRHVTPFKEHFLEQMEYTGPGRAIPEPTDLDSVKIGFLGPIESTVSVATGGRSHEEALGIAMMHGCQLAVEQANERGGY